MPLLPVKKQEKKEEYKYTEVEEVILKKHILPLEQVLSANQNTRLLKKMVADETRDPNFDKTLLDVYAALLERKPERILAATRSLTIKEKKSLVDAIRYTLLAKKEFPLNTEEGEDALRRLILLEDESIDLFDLCIKLEGIKLYSK